MADISPKEPLINHNPALQQYYTSLESRLGYRIFLGGTRHFGYYSSASSWPLSVNSALRAMEDRLYEALQLPRGAKVLDAGCGVGHVALHMAERGGFQVQGIDVIDHHIEKARHNIQAASMGHAVTVSKMDYHNLDSLPDQSFDGVYTVETFVHATDPEAVLRGFLRLLKPGGVLVLLEYDHIEFDKADRGAQEAMKKINQFAAMPANDAFDQGVLDGLLEKVGFESVKLTDLSPNIVPMLLLFYLVAFIPYFFFVKPLGLEKWFINTTAGVESYRGRHYWRYIQVTGRKPASESKMLRDLRDVVERKGAE